MILSPKPSGVLDHPRRGPRDLIIAALLAAIVAGVYVSALRNDFVNFDDPVYISANPHVRAGLTWEGARWAFTTMEAGFWQPLAWLSHMADCELFGLRARGHHLTSVLLHAASTVLLFLALQRMTGAPWRSALVAALFGLHPLHVETVAWAADRKDVLSGLFWMLALLAYAAYVKPEGRMQNAEGKQRSRVRAPRTAGSFDGTTDHGPQPTDQASGFTSQASRFTFHVSRSYLLCLLFYACALMSKGTVLTLPLILLLLDYWPLGRFRLKTPDSRLKTCSALIWEKLPFLALACFSALLSLRGQTGIGAVGAAGTFPIAHRVHNALLSYVHYLAQTVWPARLAFFYPYPAAFPLAPLLGAALLGLAVTLLVVGARRRWPWLLVGWSWFVLTMLPQIGLIQIGGHSRADRYTYLPLIGLFIMLAWGLGELCRERRVADAGASIRKLPAAAAHNRLPTGAPSAGAWLAPTLATLALAACCFLSARQLQFWRSSETLCRHAVAATEGNYVAYGNLGLCLWQEGRAEEAIDNYRNSLAIAPSFESADNLAIALVSRGQFAEAVPLEEAALRIRPGHSDARKRLALALAQTGNLDDAIAHYRLVLQTAPGEVTTRQDLGVALMRRGKLDEAIIEFREALGGNPELALAHANLGHALAAQEKFAEAIGHYRSALRPMPAAPVLRYELGVALLREGNREEAAEQLREALRLKPDYAEARRQLESVSTPLNP